ncbi:acyltransferase [Gleimia coleocanis DSM 15436]|uniref:Acyltransferase n=1 Tax=Gleimia coleocanis DSM 15436 TaxID=525245 RepID=C0W116_9ACTO|nr:acyltransferase family protein [Gleimia coleocanis]EEH63740.1 acyltransferase [Gleimia coleocanis DSM 15436]
MVAVNQAGESTGLNPQKTGSLRPIRGLDGLRALAALAVLGYHLLPGQIVGGFLGVDVFFVLSGFLITSLLVSEYDRKGALDLKRFWIRRVRRLFPAAFLMAIVTVIVAGLFSIDLLAGIIPQFLGVITFSYNWVEIFQGASYFDIASPHLWTNVWSLAVEQQFYLIWPLVTVIILRLRKSAQWAVPFVLAIISAGLMAWYVTDANDFTRAYQGTDSHAFGLMAGSSLAFLSDKPFTSHAPSAWYNRFARGFLSWVGLVVMLATYYFIPDNQTWVYPAGMLISVTATVLVIQGFLPTVDSGSGPGKLLAGFLSLAPFRWLGERSYGIYLWHWPIWVIVVTQFPRLSTWTVAVVVLLLSVLIAHLSFEFVEEPMRRNGIFPTIRGWLGDSVTLGAPTKLAEYQGRRFSFWQALAPALALITVLGVVLGFFFIAPEKSSAQKVVEAGQDSKPKGPFSLLRADAPQLPFIALPELQELDPVDITGQNIYVLGDSVTVASTPSLEAVFPGIYVDAAVSRHMYQAPEMIAAAATTGQLRPYVVVSLATNSEAEIQYLETILNEIGPTRRLILVTGFGPERIEWIAASNKNIRDFAKKYPSRVRVANWDEAIAPHTDYLASDFIHPSVEGGDVFAGELKTTLESYYQKK